MARKVPNDTPVKLLVMRWVDSKGRQRWTSFGVRDDMVDTEKKRREMVADCLNDLEWDIPAAELLTAQAWWVCAEVPHVLPAETPELGGTTLEPAPLPKKK